MGKRFTALILLGMLLGMAVGYACNVWIADPKTAGAWLHGERKRVSARTCNFGPGMDRESIPAASSDKSLPILGLF